MGKHSNLGPIDPQHGGIPAHAAKEEFETALRDVQQAPATAPIWQVLISKYGPAQISESKKVIVWADQMVRQWLRTGMFDGQQGIDAKIDHIIQELGDHSITMSHARHISFEAADSLGLEVVRLEADQGLQDNVLSVHHAAIITLTMTPAIKIIENNTGIAQVTTAAQPMLIMGGRPMGS
jgi:hypothetical protein